MDINPSPKPAFLPPPTSLLTEMKKTKRKGGNKLNPETLTEQQIKNLINSTVKISYKHMINSIKQVLVKILAGVNLNFNKF